jgi:hypothetical protein
MARFCQRKPVRLPVGMQCDFILLLLVPPRRHNNRISLIPQSSSILDKGHRRGNVKSTKNKGVSIELCTGLVGRVCTNRSLSRLCCKKKNTRAVHLEHRHRARESRELIKTLHHASILCYVDVTWTSLN